MPVNKNVSSMSVKAYMLNKFRGNPGAFFTGEGLARDLGVSRVAVWKQIKDLETAGYPVTRSDKGYRWNSTGVSGGGNAIPGDDFLYPWEFGEREKYFHHWILTDSTMNRAAELAGRGCPGGSVITAGEQSAGRGRNGKNWSSKEGGLFFTLLERPEKAAGEYPRIAMAAQIAAAKALSRICGREILLRWPNDLYAGGRKIAGVLTEFRAGGDCLEWISIGMGINVNNRAKPRNTVNCAELLGHPLSRREVLLAILDQWDSIKADDPRNLHKLWNAFAEGLGQKAAVVRSKGTDGTIRPILNGTFLGADQWGRGIIKTGKGEIRHFFPGLVSFIF
jgi:BirA family biotin operon repressor/biotin-[acetyl-CoA-carboxylase] ligase